MGTNSSAIDDTESVKRQLVKMKEDEEFDFQTKFKRIDLKMKLATERHNQKKA